MTIILILLKIIHFIPKIPTIFRYIYIQADEEDISYVVKFTYQGYKIEHQNKNIPLDAKNGNYTFVKELYFSLDKSTLFGIDWEIIKYKEEKGLLGLFDDWINKKNEYVAFDISSISKITTEKIIKLNLLETVDLRLLSTINFGERNIQYVEYKRTKKSLLDVLANVGSLFSSFLAIFNYIFSLYSRNLNNYQIMQKFLSDPKKLKELNIKTSRPKTIKFKNINNTNKKDRNFDKQSIDTSKSVPFKSNDKNKITENNEDKNDENINLDGVYFIHFLLKHFKCKYKNMKNKIDIINTCNAIIFKYLSIENILYSQIIFENLLKDYKWNEQYLTRIDSNLLLGKLKSIT